MLATVNPKGFLSEPMEKENQESGGYPRITWKRAVEMYVFPNIFILLNQ